MPKRKCMWGENKDNEVANAGMPGAAGEGPVSLTDAELITLEYYPPPPDLQLLVTTFYYFRCDEREIVDIQPAAVGAIIVFLKGQGNMYFDGRADPSHPVSLLAPATVAAPFEVEGPFHCIGAALSPLGWAVLTGLKADKYRDMLMNAVDHLGRDVSKMGDRVRSAYLAGEASPEQMCVDLSAFIATHVRPVNLRHARLIALVSQWLSKSYNPSIEELAEMSEYSVRQVQRLVERYFGVTPKMLIRKYRALRVAAHLQDPDTDDETIAELINLFYDQSHLIREIRLFAGRTPARLSDTEKPILKELLSMRNFREIKPNVAAIPDD